MKKELCAALLLAALIIGSLINITYLRALTGGLLETLSHSRSLADSGDFDAAEKSLRDAIERWNSSDGYTHIFIRHSEIDSTTDAFYELLSSVLAGEAGSAKAGYEKLVSHLESIMNMERVTLGSIF